MIHFPTLLLASKSPRRHQILRAAGLHFEVVNIKAEEDFPDYLQREQVCEFLASHKATHFTESLGEKILVTADTIVCLGNRVINKPSTKEQATEMLASLSGRIHEVFTGVCMRNNERQQVFYERSEVEFYPLTPAEMAYYIEHFKPFDKAGAYGVQDWMGYMGIKRINGCFYNVMGFPMSRFYRELQQFIT
ncbi:MAG: septum formation protein Maf [Bacteroidetes bacterium]|nr:septum formation protein Maf [Bacteroidota bacterium]